MNQRLSHRLVFFVSGMLIGVVSPSWGQTMLSPVEVLGTDLGTFNETVPLVHMIDQSGVEVPFTSEETNFDTYFASPRFAFAMNNPASNWQSDTSFSLPVQGFVDFDLGASYRVGRLAIWNVSIKDVTVKLAEVLAELPTSPVAGEFTLTDHTSFPFSYPVDILDFEASHKGRYLRLEIKSTYPIVPGVTFGYAIIGEVVASVAPGVVPPFAKVERNEDGSVTVTFSGRLKTSSDLAGSFSDVSGNPTGSYTIPAAELSAQQYFKAVGE